MTDHLRYEVSSGNVFADLGHPNPEEALMKAKLALVISQLVDTMGWTDEVAAEEMGVDNQELSDLLAGRLRRFSTDRLFHLITILDHDVDIVVHPKRREERRATINVTTDLAPIGVVMGRG